MCRVEEQLIVWQKLLFCPLMLHHWLHQPCVFPLEATFHKILDEKLFANVIRTTCTLFVEPLPILMHSLSKKLPYTTNVFFDGCCSRSKEEFL